jgi:hypothetical protein
MKTQSGYSQILLIIAVVLFLVAGFFYFNRQKPTTYNPFNNLQTAEVSEDQDADSVNLEDIDQELSQLEADASEL